MAASPVAVLLIIGIYVTIYAAITATTPDTMGLDEDPGVPTTGYSGFGVLGEIINAIITVVEMIFGAITFNVEGAPYYVRIPVAIAITTSLLWSGVTLIRGTSG